eukprot:NODE_114_length_19305_cov_0.149849.p10 type:complete len:167 gc:universal NODE_114_length_19305_cov_0.149849:10881-10381(-)
MSLKTLPYDLQLKIFQHVPDIPVLCSSTKLAQTRISKNYPRFNSEESLASFDDWQIVKECDVSDTLSSESKKFIFAKVLGKKNVKSFQIMNKWRAELVSECSCNFKRLKLCYITEMDIEKIFANITVGELSILGNKWNSISPETVALVKQKCQSIVGPPELLKTFE